VRSLISLGPVELDGRIVAFNHLEICVFRPFSMPERVKIGQHPPGVTATLLVGPNV
jgi:hypothetical protein